MSVNFIPGLIQSPADWHDWIYGAKVGLPELPSRFLRTEHPVGKQQTGDCVGWAGAALKEGQENGSYRRFQFSPSFLYQECKRIDGIPNQQGTHIKALMQVLQKQGACLEPSYPYSPNVFPVPSKAAYDEAGRFKVKNYAKAQTVDEIKAALYRDGPVVMGVLVCENFTGLTGKVIPLPSGRYLGLHAICCTGYDDTLELDGFKGFFRIRNSWGVQWKDKGYAWLPYAALSWRSDLGMPMVFEAWTSVDLPTDASAAKKIEVWAGKKVALVDGMEVALDQAPVLDQQTGRLLMPMRFVGEMASYAVDWDGTAGKATFVRK